MLLLASSAPRDPCATMRFSSLDVYAKTLPEFRQRTGTGGIVSITCTVLIALLAVPTAALRVSPIKSRRQAIIAGASLAPAIVLPQIAPIRTTEYGGPLGIANATAAPVGIGKGKGQGIARKAPVHPLAPTGGKQLAVPRPTGGKTLKSLGGGKQLPCGQAPAFPRAHARRRQRRGPRLRRPPRRSHP